MATSVWDGLEDTVDGIVGTVKHPLQTAENLKTAALHPLKTRGAIKDSVVDSWNKEMIKGDAKSRAHWIGNAATQVALSIFGTKGADKFAKTLKLSKMPKVPNVLKAKRKGKITKAFNAVHPKLQSVFNVLSPVYIRKVVEKTYDDMLRATKMGMRKTLDAIGNIGFKVYAVTPEGHKIPVKVTLKDLWLKITTNENKITGNDLAGVRIVNKKYAGKVYKLNGDLGKKYPEGVKFSKEGFPDFSPYSKANLEIEGLIGDHYYDFKKANEAIGLKNTPAGYTWHHVEDGKTMMLVPSDIHGAVRHTGGASLIKKGLRP